MSIIDTFYSFATAPARALTTPSNSLTRSSPTSGSSLDAILARAPSSSGGGGGGGGGGFSYIPPDHFFDVNPLDQEMFDWRKVVDQHGMDIAGRGADRDDAYLDLARAAGVLDRDRFDLDTAKFEHDKAMADREWALAMGDFELAQKKLDDANYWAGIEAGFTQQRINLENQGQQLDYATRMAQIEQQRQASNQNYQANMANAQNDRDRIAAENAWRQEQAAIARMQDETERILGGQRNQTAQFGAETDRAIGMGNLALENNRFIMEMATNPRNLPALFMMQRGVTPDWDTMAAGGTPAQGQALRPYDPMTAFVPTTQAPTFSGTPANSQASRVGSAVGSFSLGANPFINLDQLATGSSVPAPTFLPFQDASPVEGPGKTDIKVYADINPGGRQGGVPLSELKPGMNLSTVGGGDIKGSNFTMPAYYDQAKTRPIGPDDIVKGGSKVWVDYQVPEAYASGTLGYTNDRVFIAGDAPGSNMAAGGARPEIIENPTGAPIRVLPNPKTVSEMNRYATGTRTVNLGPANFVAPNSVLMDVLGIGAEARAAHRDPGPQTPAASSVANAMAGQWASTSGTATRQPVGGQWASTSGTASRMQPVGGVQAGSSLVGRPAGQDMTAFADAAARMRAAATPSTTTPPPGGYSIAGAQPLGPHPVDPSQRDALVSARNRMDAALTGASGYAVQDINRNPVVSPRVTDRYFTNPPVPYQPSQPAGNMYTAMPRQQPMAVSQPNLYDWLALPSRLNSMWQREPFRFRQPSMVPRFALGTDAAQEAYNQLGMGGYWVPDSSNAHLAGQELPPRLQMLADAGYPVNPAMAAAATGQLGPQLNLGAALNEGRGLGTLMSLQQLGRQTKSETEATRGYYEGVGGAPWADIVDWIQKPTSHLGSAQRARGV